MKTIQTVVNTLGLTAQLVPSPTNEKNCKYVIVNGIQYKSSQWTRDDAEAVLSDIACKGTEEVKSVAKQKVNEAWGYDEEQRIEHYIKQFMTYADPFAGIQFKNRTLLDVLNQIVENQPELCNYRVWVESMKHWHANAKVVVMNMLQNKDVRIVGDYVIPTKTFERFLDKYCVDNEIEYFTDDKKNEIIEEYVRAQGGI